MRIGSKDYGKNFKKKVDAKKPEKFFKNFFLIGIKKISKNSRAECPGSRTTWCKPPSPQIHRYGRHKHTLHSLIEGDFRDLLGFY